MVKCAYSCLIFLKKLFGNTSNQASQPNIEDIANRINTENLNITSLNDKNEGIEAKPEIELEENASFQIDIVTGVVPISAKIIESMYKLQESPSSDICLSPISKRSQSEDFSPIKIPSPSMKRILNRIPAIFMHKDHDKMPKISAATPRVRMPRIYT